MKNVYCNEFDQYVKCVLKIKYYARYCDDFVLVDKSRGFLENTIPRMSMFLESRLKLELHSRKITIRKVHQGIDFLGYVSLPYYRVLCTKTKNRTIKKIRDTTILKRSELISSDKFKQILASYAGMLSHCKSEQLKKLLKKYILTRED